MNGLFEDDANVRRQPKPKAPPKKPTAKKSSPKKSSLGDRILGKVENKDTLVEVASGTEGVKFEDIDVVAASKTAKKSDSGRIVPQINYVSDNDDDV